MWISKKRWDRLEKRLVDLEEKVQGYQGEAAVLSEQLPEPMQWRRFELLTEGEAERERLERVLRESNLSRRDLAIILLGLRVRPEFGKEDFGI